VMCGELRDN